MEKNKKKERDNVLRKYHISYYKNMSSCLHYTILKALPGSRL